MIKENGRNVVRDEGGRKEEGSAWGSAQASEPWRQVCGEGTSDQGGMFFLSFFGPSSNHNMGILSNLLTQYSGSDDKAKTESVSPPVSQPQQQAVPHTISQLPSSSPKQNGLLSVDDELREKMRTNPRARAVRQLSLFFAGATFFGLSLLVTRRAVARKLLADAPKQFTPSNYKPTNVNGGVEAAQAFVLATANVTSAGMMATGFMMYALDVTDTEDMRTKFRKAWGFERTALDEAEQDEEMEKMVKEFLDKKEGGDNKGMAEGLAGLVAAMAAKEEEKLAKLQKMKEGLEATSQKN